MNEQVEWNNKSEKGRENAGPGRSQPFFQHPPNLVLPNLVEQERGSIAQGKRLRFPGRMQNSKEIFERHLFRCKDVKIAISATSLEVEVEVGLCFLVKNKIDRTTPSHAEER